MKNSAILTRLTEIAEELDKLRREFRRNLDTSSKKQLQEVYDAAEQVEYNAYDMADDAIKAMP